MRIKPIDFSFVNKPFELGSFHFKNDLAALVWSVFKHLLHFNVLSLTGNSLLSQQFADFFFDFSFFFLTYYLFWIWMHPRNFPLVKMTFKLISINSKREFVSLMYWVATKYLFNFKL